MTEWKETTLGDICLKITDGAHHSPKEFEGGKPMFSVKNMRDQGFDYNGVKTISEEDFVKLVNSGCQPKSDDILIAKDGSVMKHVFRVKGNVDYVLLSSIAIVRPDIAKVNPSYLVYAIKDPSTTDLILNNFVGGSGVPRIVLKDFKKVDLTIPDIQTQKAIAETLSSLDDKIDLLHRQNKTLEQMAETLFRQWFLEEEVNLKPLGECIQTTSGGTPSRKNMDYYENGTVQWIKSKELNRGYLLDTEEKITEDAINNSSAKILPKNSVLIAMYGATVGEYAIIGQQATCNQAICACIPNKDFPYTYIYYTIKANEEELINMAVGSAQQNISQVLIKGLDIPVDETKIKLFHEEVDPMMKKIKLNYKHMNNLKNMRDTLLPKLMSGEVTVN